MGRFCDLQYNAFQIAYNQGYGLWHEGQEVDEVPVSSAVYKITQDEAPSLKY